jgi:hypothetical protein
MRGSWWIFVEVTTTVTSMASLTVNREANIGLRVSETSTVSSAENRRDKPDAAQGETINPGFGKSGIRQPGRKRLTPEFYSSPESCDNHN